MKILFVIPGLSIGGQEKMGMVITNALFQKHEVLVVCFEEFNPDQFQYKSPIYRITNTISDNYFFKFLNVLKRIISLRKIKKKFNPEISISFGETAIISNGFSFSKEKKIAAIRQSLRFLNNNKFIYGLAYKQHDRIVPVNQEINCELKNIYNIGNNIFINNGYDVSEIQYNSNEKLDDNIQSFYNNEVLVHLGRFDVPKGHWYLIDIFILLKRVNPKAKLILIGSYVESNEIYVHCKKTLLKNGMKIQSLPSNDLNLSGFDVLFTGHQSNPFKFLKSATVFIFPSLWEGFPNALVEAMCCGLPIVAANCKTGPEEILVVEDEFFGILLPAFTKTFNEIGIENKNLLLKWANCISDLLNNPQKLDYYKRQSIKRAQKFTLEIMNLKWLNLLNDTIQSK